MMKLLILGASGFVGSNLYDKLSGNYEVIGTCHSNHSHNKWLQLDCTTDQDIRKWLKLLNPDVVINCVGYKDVPNCEINTDKAFELNAHVPRRIGSYASPHTKIIHISTDYVYNSEQTPKNEYTIPSPSTAYGNSKYAGEKLLFDSHANTVAIRTGGLYGRGNGFIPFAINNITQNKPFNAFSNVKNTPTYIGNLVNFIRSIIVQDLTGIRNFADRDSVTRYELALKVSELIGGNNELVKADFAPPEMRIPEDLSLTSVYSNPESTSLTNGLKAYLKER